MLRNFLVKFSFLMISLLFISCASQKSITPFNTTDVNPELNSGLPAQKIDNPIAEKPIAVPLSQSVEVQKEETPVKETSSAIEQTTVSKAQPVPENISITLNVQFDTGKANIKPKYHNDIKRIADAMSKYPSTSVVIVGHTDNVGKELVNVKLSYLRAANIKAYLVQKFGIDSSRIRVIGYDYQKPIASNKTAQGRQANRRGETQIETNVAPNRLYSFFEDSDFPKGGFSIVNQESIDEKIKSFKEKYGAASYASKIVKEPTLELYKMWRGVFSHCTIRIEADPNSFYQLELQNLSDLKKAGMKDYHQTGAAISLFGMIKDQMDIVEFTDKNERAKLDSKGPNYATMPICIDNKAARKSTQWYQDCLRSYAGSYNPENALKAGKRTKVFEYEPVTHNCCNFAEEALKACGLAHCFDFGKSTGLDHKTGPLEE
jgi:outer membrane protein OmpA-like peptidoglycan-associated protein